MTAMRARPLDTQLAELTERLVGEFTQRGVSASTVHDAVDAVRAEFADATVLTYVPVLVERGVRDRLPRVGIPGTGR